MLIGTCYHPNIEGGEGKSKSKRERLSMYQKWCCFERNWYMLLLQQGEGNRQGASKF